MGSLSWVHDATATASVSTAVRHSRRRESGRMKGSSTGLFGRTARWALQLPDAPAFRFNSRTQNTHVRGAEGGPEVQPPDPTSDSAPPHPDPQWKDAAKPWYIPRA